MTVARQVVGPSGHATRPHGSTLEAYRRCLPANDIENRHVKVIVNLEYALRVADDPHTFLYLARPPRRRHPRGRCMPCRTKAGCFVLAS